MTTSKFWDLLARAALPVIAALALVPVLTGCATGDVDFRPSAVGREGEVVVVIDSGQWAGDIGEALRETVGQYVGTLPAPERTFDLRPLDLETQEDLEQVRQRKNVIFVAPLSDTTNEARYIKNVFDEQAQEAIRAGRQAVIARPDLWRREQQVFYITGATAEDVAASIRARGDELVDAFNEITRERVEEEMFEKGRQFDLEDTLMARHGFAVNVQHDYLIATDTTRFVWLRRILSDTWRSLFVYYVEDADPSMLTPYWIYQTRDSLTRRYIQGQVMGAVEIDRRRPLVTESIDFLGRYGFETRGLWHVVDRSGDQFLEAGMGGPFLTYTFYDQASDRIYMIDGMVFAPSYSKREFLRHMEVIAHTFRTRQETASVPAP